MSKHPAACPYCGGTIVNQAQPDMILRHAQLNDDGSIIVGDQVDSADFTGPSILYCHGCGSEYVQPTGVEERYIGALKIDYPPALVAPDRHTVIWEPHVADGSMPLRLSFEPDAIREHFADDEDDLGVSEMTDVDLIAIGSAALQSMPLYETFHAVLEGALLARRAEARIAATSPICDTCGAALTPDGARHLPPYGEHEEPIVLRGAVTG